MVHASLRAMLRPGAPAYLTVELPAPVPLVEGLEPGEEIAGGGGYHYYRTEAIGGLSYPGLSGGKVRDGVTEARALVS